MRAGPLPPAAEGGGLGWTVHAIVDGCLLELIVNGQTALVAYARPADDDAASAGGGADAALFGVADADAATLDVWQLASANHTLA